MSRGGGVVTVRKAPVVGMMDVNDRDGGSAGVPSPKTAKVSINRLVRLLAHKDGRPT